MYGGNNKYYLSLVYNFKIMTKKQKIVYYVLLVAVSALFIVASLSKLTGQTAAEAGFTVSHLPIWFMYFVGIAEMCGVIGLWTTPKLQQWAAYGLYIVLIGAVVTTAMYESVALAIFPLVTGIVLSIVVSLGKKRSKSISAVL